MVSSDDSSPTPEQLVAELCFLLELEERGADRFSGRQQPGGIGRVFGGQVIAQALGAAKRTVTDDRQAHSLHAYFLRPGVEGEPIEYRVKRDFDGRSFSNRRVVASQRGEPILNLVTSFQRGQEGPRHQATRLADIPGPDDLLPDSRMIAKYGESLPDGPLRQLLLRPRPIEFRSVEPIDWLNPTKRPPKAYSWVRTIAPLPDNQAVHRAVLSYVSDYQMMSTAILPHGLSLPLGQVKGASLDHAMWFHEDFRADQWLLFVTDSPWGGNARGFVRGEFFKPDGTLVASVAQEGMMRHA